MTDATAPAVDPSEGDAAAADAYGDAPEQVRVRLEKRQRLLDEGVDPYPVGFPRTATLAEVRERFDGLPPDTATGERVGITGRVVLSRTGGKLCFASLRDATGDLQVMVALDGVGEDALAGWKRDVDLGDHVGVEGEVITSRRGELSVRADRWAHTSKALRPFPEKWRGLSDPESRVRQRWVDLTTRPEAREALRRRAAVVRAVRDGLHGRGYVEVDTPVLQPLHGGAAARPFVTHMNAYDVDLYLRIALELYLKRLVVGGVERVFEIGRIFRNEGADSTHNPEFTMLEAYEAYGDYDTMADLTRTLVQEAAQAALGTLVVERADRPGEPLDLSGEWRSVTLHGAVSDALGVTVDPGTPVEELREHAAARDVALQDEWGAAEVVVELFEQLVEDTLWQPTFVRDWPVEVRPLTRQHRDDPRLTEAWDLVVGGVELATAYSELVDPVEQRRRLTAQSLKAAGGDPEAMQLDEDFLAALEFGMPPTGGMGMGVDRLVMTLTGSGIRDTLAFPLVRPESR